MTAPINPDFRLFGQVAFPFHASLSSDEFRVRLRNALDIIPLSALLAGWDGSPHFWESCAEEAERRKIPLYLWRPILSNLPSGYERLGTQGLDDKTGGVFVSTHLKGPAGHFEFSCPNHPETSEVVSSIVQRNLNATGARGIFLDKIRYPSPAAGLTSSLSCFCQHCTEKARARHLDLRAVQKLLGSVIEAPISAEALSSLGIGGRKQSDTLIAEWQDFRAGAITNFVGQIVRQARVSGCDIGLDLFTPFLSDLVGQDYKSLAPLGDWIKPMIYCRSAIPSGLPIEIHGILQSIPSSAKSVLANALDEEIPDSQTLMTEGLPLTLAVKEAARSQLWAGEIPSLAGIEVANRPGICRIDPEIVGTYGRLLRSTAGIVASPDILLASHDNLRALRHSLF